MARWVENQQAFSDARMLYLYQGREAVEAVPDFCEGSYHPVFADHAAWRQERAFVAAVPLGRVWGRRGAVVTADGFLLGDVSREFGAYKGISDERHSVFSQIILPSPVHIAGQIGVAAVPGSRNYHHWLFDCLPRLHLLVHLALRQEL